MKNIVKVLCVVGLVCLPILSGCQSKAGTGALVGGALGAGVGQAAGGSTKATVVGGLAGAAAGGLIGNEMDKADQREAQRDAYMREQVNTRIVNVTNSNGSTTPVRLRRVGAQWQGPRGEYYNSLPTGAQLRGIYGF